MQTTFRLFLFLSFPILHGDVLFSQKAQKFWVEFSDKNNSPFSIFEAQKFLSPRSIQRREKAGVLTTEEDLPVNPAYLNSLKMNELGEIFVVSRWLNAAAIKSDSSKLEAIKQLPFVKKVSWLGPHIAPKNPPKRRLKGRTFSTPMPEKTDNYFGYSGAQLGLTNEPILHFFGATGQGKIICVMDGGFANVDTLPFFDSLFLKHQLFQGPDFVEKDGHVFEMSSHGTAVLSVMASDVPSFFMGAAPEATYFCIKTEDTGGEFPIEEANWTAGAEWADSLGADVINASLGYTKFNDARLGHDYFELDGRTTIASRAAKIAAQKGMIVCNAAGNEGDGDWHFIGSPADAAGVISVGATDLQGKKASFSSFGPTADGRLKPDLSVPGQSVVVASIKTFDLEMSAGTSIASPILAGSLAALWSAFPEKTAAEILAATYLSASQNEKPDNEKGWGVPDFLEAWAVLGGFEKSGIGRGRELLTSCFDSKKVEIQAVLPFSSQVSEVVLETPFSKKVRSEKAFWSKTMLPNAAFEVETALPAGLYFLKTVDEKGVRRGLVSAVR